MYMYSNIYPHISVHRIAAMHISASMVAVDVPLFMAQSNNRSYLFIDYWSLSDTVYV